MKNQIFDWSRFVVALRKEVVENWRQLALAVLVTYGVLTMIMILGNWISSGDDDRALVLMRYTYVFSSLAIASTVMASLAFRGLMTKAGRTELLTSPSSMAEKFAVNVVVYVLGYIVAFIVVTQLADLTRVCLLWPARSTNFHVPGPINFLVSIQELPGALLEELEFGNSTLFRISAYLSLLVNPALYLLASVLWPRLSFLKMFAAVYAVEMVGTIIFMIVMCSVYTFSEFVDVNINAIQSGSFSVFMLVVSVLQLVIYWVLAWVVFRRKDVVSRGMFH